MLSHIVIFTWKPSVTQEQVRDFSEALENLRAEVSDLGQLEHGSDMRIRDGNGDYALVAIFPDRAAWDAYQAHPQHKAFVRDVVTPLQQSRLTIQFEHASTSSK